jgi:anti-sigma regulatory factor (Ser/Thr protein kinase)
VGAEVVRQSLQGSHPQVRLELSTASVPRAVRRARRAIEALDAFESDSSVAFDIRLLISELVGNAVTHCSQQNQEHVELVAAVVAETVRVEVSDGGPGFILGQERAEPAPDQESGRGLYLLRSLVDRYGVGEEGAGGQVWFEIDLARGEASSSVEPDRGTAD